MDDIFKNIEEYNPNKKCEILIIIDDMIADLLSNKKLNRHIEQKKLKKFSKGII